MTAAVQDIAAEGVAAVVGAVDAADTILVAGHLHREYGFGWVNA